MGRATFVCARGLGRATTVAALVLCLLGVAGTALAQQGELLDQAQTEYDQADFKGALRVLQQIEREGGLPRADFVRLLELRGLVRLGLGDTTGMQRDMACLASIDPHHTFRAGAPPDLLRAFDAAAQDLPGPLRIEAQVVPTPAGVSVEASVVNDPLALVRQVRVNARGERGAFHIGMGSVQLATTNPGGVQFFVQALGPGGAVLASVGSATAPIRAPAPPPPHVHVAASEHSHGSPWVWITVVGGAVAIAAVGAVLIGMMSGGNDGSPSTQPSMPMRIPW